MSSKIAHVRFCLRLLCTRADCNTKCSLADIVGCLFGWLVMRMYSDKRGWTYQLPLGTRVGFIVSENITPGDIAPEVTPRSQIGSGVGYGLMPFYFQIFSHGIISGGDISRRLRHVFGFSQCDIETFFTFWISLSLSGIATNTHRPQGVNLY